jgi:ATP-dependent exoDNAse (exonuclease V) alpha subunit
MAIVYQHRRLDTNEIFYIGIGRSKRRIKSKTSRNQYWHNIVSLYGYSSEILYDNISWDDACKIEVDLIKKYGRKDINTGILSNMTDGGDGLKNISDELREKVGQKKGFKHTEESKLLISECQKGKKHYRYGKKVDKIVCDKIANTLKGKYGGEKSGSSILTNENVLFIRTNYKPRDKKYSTPKLAKMFNVNVGTIWNVINYKTWNHI